MSKILRSSVEYERTFNRSNPSVKLTVSPVVENNRITIADSLNITFLLNKGHYTTLLLFFTSFCLLFHNLISYGKYLKSGPEMDKR